MGGASKDGVGSIATLTTKDSMEDVTAWYQSELEANGWAVEASFDMGEMKILTFKKDNREGGVTITKSEEETSIMLSINK